MRIGGFAFHLFISFNLNQMKHSHLIALQKEQSHRVADWQQFLPLAEKRRKEVKHLGEKVEKVLLSRLSGGDKSAFSVVFSAYYRDLVAFAISFTHNQSLSEEIVQETFVKLWEDHESLQIEQSLKSYLLATVRNKCINWYRHRKIIHIHAANTKEYSPYFTCDTEEYLLYSELQNLLDTALEKLPIDISGPFRMNRNQALKYHEIADIMGVSVRTIEVRIGKALHILRNYLKDYFQVIIIVVISGCI